MSEMPAKPRNRLIRFLSSEILLGTLVALLSILTAASAYFGALADSAESDANVEGQKILSNSNTEYLRINQDIIQDYTMYDGYYINSGKDEELSQYYKENFSDELTASLDRPKGPFDDEYYTAMFTEADNTYQQAVAKFDEAQKSGDKADRFQLVVLIFAVGLALSAWASVGREDSPMRPVFTLISLASLVFGLINTAQLFLS